MGANLEADYKAVEAERSALAGRITDLDISNQAMIAEIKAMRAVLEHANEFEALTRRMPAEKLTVDALRAVLEQAGSPPALDAAAAGVETSVPSAVRSQQNRVGR